ncbi:YybH family protein [Parendozoicomonas haliclonae]|uniref:SnoaL-like domain protein n=1 Tax=Parendozoicomonas haliclonae TaxID=1960125 RepID=A0A1X7ANC4_9GAMM|nr:nuclear transport factor 2 family protein [Parendozoicomonas haliclonae]SMA49775.1 SnoaL-like domain protein [Parendozoicomonas haliclonae]
MANKTVLELCQEGIAAWQQAFNRQDAAGCAAQYKEGTKMHAQPFGDFEGREAIQAFWQNIMDQGFADVDYTDVKWEQVDDNGYLLSASWTMNKAYGVVHREHWAIDDDGKARLVSDHFEVQGER